MLNILCKCLEVHKHSGQLLYTIVAMIYHYYFWSNDYVIFLLMLDLLMLTAPRPWHKLLAVASFPVMILPEF